MVEVAGFDVLVLVVGGVPVSEALMLVVAWLVEVEAEVVPGSVATASPQPRNSRAAVRERIAR